MPKMICSPFGDHCGPRMLRVESRKTTCNVSPPTFATATPAPFAFCGRADEREPFAVGTERRTAGDERELVSRVAAERLHPRLARERRALVKYDLLTVGRPRRGANRRPTGPRAAVE